MGRVGLLAVGLMVASPLAAEAHGLVLSAKCGPGGIAVEVRFDGDEPADGATVSLHAATGALLATAEADEDGRCAFARPAPGVYEVQADAGAGHRARTTLPVGADGTDSAGSPRPRRDRWGGIALGLAVIAAGVGVLKLRNLTPRPPSLEGRG